MTNDEYNTLMNYNKRFIDSSAIQLPPSGKNKQLQIFKKRR